jgi:hypothetical protein
MQPGTYRLTLYKMDYPEDFHDNLLRQRLSPRDARLYALMNRGLIPLGCISAISLVASPWLLGWRLWSATTLPLCVALALPPILIYRWRPYREARRLSQAIEREYPDFCAVLEAGSNKQ